MEEPPFRINKRRKVVFRKRFDEDEDPASEAPLETPTGAANGVNGNEVPSTLNSDLHLVRRRPIGKKHGIAFTATTTQLQEENADDLAMVLAPQGEDTLATANDRFVKPTGRVGVAEDKHLTAYVDTKLAQMRFARSEAIAREREKSHEISIPEADLIDEISEDEDEPNLAPTNQSSMPQEYGKIQAIPRSTSTRQRRKRRLPQAPDPTVAERATMVDQIMQESFMPRYTKKNTSMIRGQQPTDPSSAGGGDPSLGGDNPSEEPIDADEAVAEAFKAEFLRGLKERNSRRRERQILNATSARAAPPKEGITPKLGGSRAQRGKMRAAKEEAKAGPAGAGGTGSG